MSCCSGHHFSVHSPDCRAHLSVQSSRPVQVEALSPQASVQLATGDHLALGWSTSSPAHHNSPAAAVASTTTSGLQPVASSASSGDGGGGGDHQRMLVDGADQLTLVILDCSAQQPGDGATAAAGHAEGRPGSGCCDSRASSHSCQTELIIRHQPCQHHHYHQYDSYDQGGRGSASLLYDTGSLADRSASQTTTRSHDELAALQQTPTPRAITGPNQYQQQQQQQQQQHAQTTSTSLRQQLVSIENSSSLYDQVDLSAGQGRPKSADEQADDNWRRSMRQIHQQQQHQYLEDRYARPGHSQSSPTAQYPPTRGQSELNHSNTNNQPNRSSPTSGQLASINDKSNNIITYHPVSPLFHTSSNIWTDNSTSGWPSRTGTLGERVRGTLDEAEEVNKENVGGANQDDQPVDLIGESPTPTHQRPQPAQKPLIPRQGHKVVKRWNWNQAQFVEEEVPDIVVQQQPQQQQRIVQQAQQVPPPPPPARTLSEHQTVTKTTTTTTSSWTDEQLRQLSAAMSPTPAVQYEPSWLAYRVPDEQSVQADPLYRDLMLELRRLEEGVGSSATAATASTTGNHDMVAVNRSHQRQITEAPGESGPSAADRETRGGGKPVFGQPISPRAAEVNEYESVEFICRLMPLSDPSMRIQWTRNGQELLESSRIVSEYEFGVVRLLIKRCEAEDEGLYECCASNSLGEARSQAQLKVNAKARVQCESLVHPAGLDKIRRLENPPEAAQPSEELGQRQAPKFLTHIADYVEKDEGDSVHFECCLGPVDDPDLKTEWFFNGRPLNTGSRFHTIDDFGFIVLDIDWLFPRDTGEYVCRATNKYGTDLTRTVLKVRPDKSIVLDSQLDGGGATTISKLHRLEFPDVGAQLPEPTEPTRPAHFVEPLRLSGPGSGGSGSGGGSGRHCFKEGDNVHFEARVGPATDGQLTVEWFHEGRPLISGHRFKPTFDFGHILLDILYVYPEDSGTYRCVARNQAGAASSELSLQVEGKPALVYQSQLPKEMEGGVQKITEMEAMWNRAPDPEEEEAPAERAAPQFVLHPKACVAFEGSCARFCCRLVGHPRPRVTWFINGQQCVSGLRYKLTYDGMYHLIVPKCQLSDAGQVRVVARNLLGECSHETQLQVKRKLDDYRGVLKNSPNPWYDEATLRAYRRQRQSANGDDADDDDDDGEDYEQFLRNFQKQRLQHQQQQQQQLQLMASKPPGGLQIQHIATELQSTSPVANQVIGYMEPETPDVYLLASSTTATTTPGWPPVADSSYTNRSPLVEPGDLHPVVMEQQAVMAPPPSTVQRALRDTTKLETTHGESATAAPSGASAAKSQAKAELSTGEQRGARQLDPSDSKDQQQQQQQQQQQRKVFGLTRRNQQADSGQRGEQEARQLVHSSEQRQLQMHELEADARMQLARQQHQVDRRQAEQQVVEASAAAAAAAQEQQHQLQVQAQVQARRDLRRAASPVGPPPAAAAENVEHGKEVHSHTHKQVQVERRANREITREIIEREIFEQDHMGFQKDNLVAASPQSGPSGAASSIAVASSDSASGDHFSQQHKQMVFGMASGHQRAHQDQRQQQMLVVEDYNQQQQQQLEHMVPPEFLQKIQPCQAIDGDEAKFECVFRGEPTPAISWYRDNKPIRSSNLYAIETDLAHHRSTLTIKRVTLNGDAVFTVKAENGAGSAKSSANLVVEPHPLAGQSLAGGHARQVDQSESSTSSHSLVLVGGPQFGGSSPAPLDQAVGASPSLASGSVRFGASTSDVRGESPLLFASEADYLRFLASRSPYDAASLSLGPTPTPSGGAGQKVIKSVRTRRLSPDELASTIRASPEGLVAPAFLQTLHDLRVRPGELARLDVRLIGSQPLEVRWLRDGQRARPDRGHKLLLEGDLYTLLILEASAHDSGAYECVASNEVGEARCGARLRVEEPAAVQYGSATSGGLATTTATTSSSSSSSFHSSTVMSSLSSQAQSSRMVAGASSSSDLMSRAAETEAEATAAASTTTTGGRMHFGLTRQPHHQLMSQYTSQAQATGGGGGGGDIPKLIKGLESQRVLEGKSVTLRCQISAHPRAEIAWFKHGDKPIKPSKYFRMFKDNDETHCLRILETFPEDAGEYKCLARAQNGHIETSATISVIPNASGGGGASHNNQ